MKMARGFGLILVAVLVAGLGLARCWAAAPAPAGGAAGGGGAPQIEGATLVNRDPVETSKFLGTTYKRETDGFKITPPAGSRIIERVGIDLMSFVVDAKSWGGSVQQITLAQVMSLQDYVKTTKADLTTGAAFKGVQVLEEKYMQKGTFPAATLTFSMEAELGPAIPRAMQERMGLSPTATAPARASTAPDVRVSLLRQELIARVKDNQFIVLTMYTPLKDREEAMKVFGMMLGEYELFDPAAMKAHRLAAIGVGKDWLAKQSAELFATKMIAQPAFYRILVGGKDVGYLRFDEGTKESKGAGPMVDVERDGHKGVILQVNFRSFPDDGSIVYGQNEAFWGFAKAANGQPIADYSCWVNVSKTRTVVPLPPNQVRPGQPAVQVVTPWIQETGVLVPMDKPHHILVTLRGDPTQRLPEGIDQVIPAEAAAPLPKILEYCWPRLVDLGKPAEMTFVVFDSATKKLALRNLIVTGTKENITIDGKAVTCFKCIDELDPNSTTIWTDKDGRIEMMRTSDQSVMVPTTEAAMLAKWAKRLGDL